MFIYHMLIWWEISFVLGRLVMFLTVMYSSWIVMRMVGSLVQLCRVSWLISPEQKPLWACLHATRAGYSEPTAAIHVYRVDRWHDHFVWADVHDDVWGGIKWIPLGYALHGMYSYVLNGNNILEWFKTFKWRCYCGSCSQLRNWQERR